MVSLWFVQHKQNDGDRDLEDDQNAIAEKGLHSEWRETVRTNLEISPQKKPWSRAQAMFYRASRDAKGDKSKIKAIQGALQVFWVF